MRAKMISFIWFFVFISSFTYNTVISEEIENVYIDVLIQRYLSIEKQLWDYIYLDGTSNEYDIMSNIRSKHMDILTDEYLAHVMSNVYVNKFIKYVDLNIFKQYDKENRQLIRLTEIRNEKRPTNSEAYLSLDTALGIYNHTIQQRLFETIRKDSENYNCVDLSTKAIGSANLDVFMFYEILSANMLLSYIFNQRFNMIQVVKHDFEHHDFKPLRKEFQSRYNAIKDLARDHIRTANRIIWMCDKTFYFKDDTDTSMQITNFLRGYVDNEINLNRQGSCWKTCSNYEFTRNYGCSEGTFCDEQKKNGINNAACSGTIVDCVFIDNKMEICPSVSNKNRRYEYIEHGCSISDYMDLGKGYFNILDLRVSDCNENGRHFGRHMCDTKPISVKSWWNFWLLECSYCFCYCDERNIDSDRYFSLKPVLSNFVENRIITGVAIVKRNGIFSWTITESKLLSHGRVQQSIYNSNKEDIFSDFKRTDSGIVDGLDYHTLSWQNRSVDLDTIILDPGFVVTGIRFVTAKGHLMLQIQATKFDFNTGLLLNQTEWVSSSSANEKTNLLLDRPKPSSFIHLFDSDLDLTDKSIPDFSVNKFIKFRPSDPDKDAAQTTVPFVDSQMVRPKKLTPLSGIGIYYKGLHGFGGFIAPNIIVYDMSPYLGNM